MIILEGPDGSGKTTLANQLVEKHGYTRFHQGPPSASENLFEKYKRVLTDAQRNGGKVVCDRLFEGELVYGPMLRGTCRVTDYQATIAIYVVSRMTAPPSQELQDFVESVRIPRGAAKEHEAGMDTLGH